MIDRGGRGPVQLSAVRIGRTNLGAGTATIDDEALNVATESSRDDAPLRVRLGSIDADGCLVCPWHRSKYDVRTGRMVRGPQGIFARVPGLGVTFKALSNGQLAQLPRAYVDDCCAMHELGDNACQLAAVITR